MNPPTPDDGRGDALNVGDGMLIARLLAKQRFQNVPAYGGGETLASGPDKDCTAAAARLRTLLDENARLKQLGPDHVDQKNRAIRAEYDRGKAESRLSLAVGLLRSAPYDPLHGVGWRAERDAFLADFDRAKTGSGNG